MESKKVESAGACYYCGTYLGADQNRFCPGCGSERGGVPADAKKATQLASAEQNEFKTNQKIIEAAGKITKETPREPGSIIVPPPESAAEKVQNSLEKIIEHRRKRFSRKHNK